MLFGTVKIEEKSVLGAVLAPTRHPGAKESRKPSSLDPLGAPSWRPKFHQNRQKDDPKLDVFSKHLWKRCLWQLGGNLGPTWWRNPTENEAKLDPESRRRGKQAKIAKCARRQGESSIFKGSEVPSWQEKCQKIVAETDRKRHSYFACFGLALGTDFSRFWVQLGTQEGSKKLKKRVRTQLQKKHENLKEKTV